jgi:hypothetical protein
MLMAESSIVDSVPDPGSTYSPFWPLNGHISMRIQAYARFIMSSMKYGHSADSSHFEIGIAGWWGFRHQK